MGDQRKNIIIAEIENWRKSNLLPEHYCIFLLNLYSEGEHRPAPTGGQKKRKGFLGSFGQETAGAASSGGYGSFGAPSASSGLSSSGNAPASESGGFSASGASNINASGSDGLKSIGGLSSYNSPGAAALGLSWKMVLGWIFGACFFAATILLAFHFNDFNTLMQIAIAAGFAIFFYVVALVFRRTIPMLTHLSLMLSFVILLTSGIYLLNKLGYPVSILLLFLMIVCLLWCFNSLVFQFTYLLYCGILGLGILYGVGTVDRIALEYSWWKVELYWVPLALLMIGLAFLMQIREHRLAGVFAICGMIFFFGAEVQSLYIPKAKHDMVQLWLFVKVFVSSAFFFFTRKYWFYWLRL